MAEEKSRSKDILLWIITVVLVAWLAKTLIDASHAH